MTIIKKILFSFIVVILFILALEASLRVIKKIITPPKESRADLSVYSDKEWCSKYLEELSGSGSEYEPFVGWKMKESEGEYINILPDRTRKTWNPEFSDEEKKDKKTVFFFGGSTMWGIGARDDFTISSLVSKKLNEKNSKYEAVNYGTFAYVFQQEILQLILLLKNGGRPDYVVFYDGVNNIYGAYQNGEPGQTQNTVLIRKRLAPPKVSKNINLIWEGVTGIIKNSTEIYRTIYKIKEKYFKENENQISDVVSSTFTDEEVEILAKQIVSEYEKSATLVENLSRVYGFKYALILQPILDVYTNLSEEEQKNTESSPVLKKLFELTYDLLLTKKYKNFYNLSKIFESKNETIFIDFAHVSEKGNDIIAQEIVKILKEPL